MNYLRIWALVWIITPIAAGGATAADPLAVAGDAENLWLLEADVSAKTFKVYHRHQSDEPNQLSPATKLTGHVAPHALAASEDRLWLIYTDPMIVQSIRVTRSAINGQWDYSPRREAVLPVVGKLRALAAGGDGPWVLLRVESDAQLDTQSTDGPSQPWAQPNDMLDIALGLPPGTGFDPAGNSTTKEKPQTQSPKQVLPLPRDHLLAMQRGKWRTVDLPEDWPHNAPAWVVMLQPTDPSPVLVVRPNAPDTPDTPDTPGAPQLWIYRQDQGQWRKQVHPIAGGTALRPLALDGQLVLASSRPDAGRNINVTLAVLRPQGVSPLGQLALDIPVAAPWAVISSQMSVVLIARDQADATGPSYYWTRMDLMGRVVQEPATMTLRPKQPLVNVASYLMLISVMVLSMLMILVFWRRDPRMNQLELPPSQVLSDFGRRAAAGLIDLLPGAVAAMLIFDLDPWQLQQRWPGMQGQETDWQNMKPGVLVIGVFLLHCIISELIPARTLGKALTGLRVCTLDGKRPQRWQLLVRNLLKILDLVAWLLLLLPLIGPYRQRLGDMVARTVVVMPAPPMTEDDEQNPDTDNKDDDP